MLHTCNGPARGGLLSDMWALLNILRPAAVGYQTLVCDRTVHAKAMSVKGHVTCLLCCMTWPAMHTWVPKTCCCFALACMQKCAGLPHLLPHQGICGQPHPKRPYALCHSPHLHTVRVVDNASGRGWTLAALVRHLPLGAGDRQLVLSCSRQGVDRGWHLQHLQTYASKG